MARQFYNVVITTGISSFAAYNAFGKLARDREYFRFELSNPLAEGVDEATALERWREDVRSRSFAEVELEPKRVSAEYSLLHALTSTGRLGPGARVTLIHSATLGGRGAVALLERVLPRDFDVRVEAREVPDLDVDDSSALRRSLGAFMSIVAAELERSGTAEVTCFAPVGGYKVMTSLGYLAGAYLGYPTAYLHEDNQALHEIPAVPITLSTEELRQAAPLMKKVGAATELSALDAAEREMVEARPFLFVREDEMVGVTAFGLFLMQRPEHAPLFGTRLLVARSETSRLDRDRVERDHALSQIGELRRKLDDREPNLGMLRHEANWDSLTGSTFWLYKGPRGSIYFAYRFDEASDTLRINRVWTNHEEYEAAAGAGRGFFDDPGAVDWVDWTDRLHGASS